MAAELHPERLKLSSLRLAPPAELSALALLRALLPLAFLCPQ